MLPRPAAALQERTGENMDRVQKAGDNHVGRLRRAGGVSDPDARPRRRDTVDAGAWTEDLADSYLALGQVDDTVHTISNTTRSGCAEGTEMPCELAEKLTRRGTSPRPASCGSRLAPATPPTSGTATSATTPGSWNG